MLQNGSSSMDRKDDSQSRYSELLWESHYSGISTGALYKFALVKDK